MGNLREVEGGKKRDQIYCVKINKIKKSYHLIITCVTSRWPGISIPPVGVPSKPRQPQCECVPLREVGCKLLYKNEAVKLPHYSSRQDSVLILVTTPLQKDQSAVY